MPQLENILVPVDFSECSGAALEYALFLARSFDAAVDVLHVWEAPQYLGMEVMVQGPGGMGQSLAQFVQAHAQKELDHLLASLEPQGNVVVRSHLETGEPHDVIIRMAEALEADLLVVGTHGRRGISHLLMGSVAERVVRRAPCPVLTVRTPKKGKATKKSAGAL